MEKIKINLDKVLKEKGKTSKELAEAIKITEANLSFKNRKSKGGAI